MHFVSALNLNNDSLGNQSDNKVCLALRQKGPKWRKYFWLEARCSSRRKKFFQLTNFEISILYDWNHRESRSPSLFELCDLNGRNPCQQNSILHFQSCWILWCKMLQNVERIANLLNTDLGHLDGEHKEYASLKQSSLLFKQHCYGKRRGTPFLSVYTLPCSSANGNLGLNRVE